MPSPDDPTLSGLFRSAVEEAPQREFLRTRTDSFTFDDAAAWSATLAGGLRDRGVVRGDRVVIAAANRPDIVAAWLACLRLGAVFTPLNPETPRVALDSLAHDLEPSLVLADSAEMAGSFHAPGVTWGELERSTPFDEWSPAAPSDWAAVLSTSGTTGPSKGVALSHRWFLKICETTADRWGFSGSDRFYCPFPLYHMDALALTVVPAIHHRTTAALGERFSVRRFWEEVRTFDATVFDFLGSTLTLLWKVEASPEDLDNPARLGWGVPMPAFRTAFEERFGCVLVDCYGSTDVGIPVCSRVGEVVPEGACGRVVDGYEVAILDTDGNRLECGVTGEIAIRPTEPNVMLERYAGRAEATLDAWRGLWHHTGDLGRLDAEGYLYFEGRVTDSIRRRGENISAQELESIVLENAAIEDAAAIAVPSELTEDDVKLVVSLRAPARLEPVAFAAWLRDALPRFMTVRYVEIRDDLPRTATGKIAKQQLRETWRSASTWDAESGQFLDDR